MTAYNYRHLIREIPAPTWRRYVESRSTAFPAEFNWDGEEKSVASGLIHWFEALPPAEQAPLHAELRHVHALASHRGIDAILNASSDDQPLREQFAQLANFAERALWTLLHQPEVFMAAEALLQYDMAVGKRAWKRQAINVTAPVSRDDTDIKAFEAALAEMFSKRKGPKRACQIDVCDRHLDGGVQVSVYVEDDPNDILEFVGDGMCRRTTRPATNLALVYYPATGVVDTVGRGGAKTHQPLLDLFAKHLLKQEIKPEAVKQPLFHLNRLRRGLEFDEQDVDLVAHGVECIRLRGARLRSTRAPHGDFWIEAATDKEQPCAFAVSREHLQHRDVFRGLFNIAEVTIAVHFLPTGIGKNGRVLNIELRQSGTSNLREMDENDAAFVEKLLHAWRVTEPAVIEQAMNDDFAHAAA